MKKIFDIPHYGEISFDVDESDENTLLKWTLVIGSVGSASYGLVVENDAEGKEFIESYIKELNDDIAMQAAQKIIAHTLEFLEPNENGVLH